MHRKRIRNRKWSRHWVRARNCPLPEVHPGLIVLVLGLVMAVICISALSARLSPLVTAVAVDEINNEIHQIVNQAADDVIRDYDISYGDIITLNYGEQGTVTSASSNIAAVNLLRTELTARILEAIDGIGLRELDIPLGNLTGIDIFSGRGPSLRVDALWVGTVVTETENEFYAAGINQTLHRVMLHVTVPVVVLLSAGKVETSVSTEVCIAENIIIGTVPETYIQLQP